jgi:hypothetical protein
MMEIKLIEIRDEGTMIIAICVNMNPTTEFQRRALRRCGYPCDDCPNILITNASGGYKADNDPYSWGGRTYPVAHDYIIENWYTLKDGDVVDVSFILGETSSPKISELA